MAATPHWNGNERTSSARPSASKIASTPVWILSTRSNRSRETTGTLGSLRRPAAPDLDPAAL